MSNLLRVDRRHRSGPPNQPEVCGGDVFVLPSARGLVAAGESLATSSYACRLPAEHQILYARQALGETVRRGPF
jgi:hypothetical protein